jgi:hypothetical protein
MLFDRRLWSFFILLANFAAGYAISPAQELPDELRGYKVHDAKITVTNRSGPTDRKDKSEAYVRLDDPVLTDKSLSGIAFDISGEIEPIGHSGKIDFLAFHDFVVNGVPVTIEEYIEPFEFRKNEVIRLPRPIKVNVDLLQTLRGALNEIRDSKEEWEVTGTVFVFGRFKKWGFNFKRVVPVRVNVSLKSPLRDGFLKD